MFLVTLPFSKQSAQVYIHSGVYKWRVYSNRSVFDLFPPLQFCRLTFPLYIFLPKVNSTHLALKEERCYFWPQVQTVSRARHESATARLTVRGSRNCPGPRSLEYSLYIWHLTSKSTARGKKSEAGFLLEKYHSDAPFLMLAITTSFFMGTMIAKVLTPYSLPIQVSDTISPPIICKQEMSEKVSSGWISD